MAHSSHLAITRILNSANKYPFRIFECYALSNVYVRSKEKETANKVPRSVKYVFFGNANSYVVLRFSVIKYAGGRWKNVFASLCKNGAETFHSHFRMSFLWLNHAFSVQSSHIKKVLDAARTIYAIM